jgi:drug/metabolite transporter (DMT)-like permease
VDEPLTELRRPPRPPVTLYALFPLLAAAIWGGMYVVSKASFSAVPPITMGFVRMAIGGAALLLLLRLGGRPVPGRQETPGLALLGAVVAATVATQFLGTALAGAAAGALLTTTTPAFVVLFARLLLDERPARRALLGLGLALVGVLVTLGFDRPLASAGPAAAADALLGGALLLLSAALWALFTVLGKPAVRRLSALVASAYATLWALPFCAPLLLWEVAARGLPALTPGAVLAALYLGLAATAGAWYLWYKGMERLDAGTVAVFFLAQPIVGGLLAALLLAEPLGPAFLVGGAIVTVGILLVSRAGTSSAGGSR